MAVETHERQSPQFGTFSCGKLSWVNGLPWQNQVYLVTRMMLHVVRFRIVKRRFGSSRVRGFCNVCHLEHEVGPSMSPATRVRLFEISKPQGSDPMCS